jgi:hypothetical protein
MAEAGFDMSLAGRVSQLKHNGPHPEWHAAVTCPRVGPRPRATLAKQKKSSFDDIQRGAVWPCESARVRSSGETS